METAGNFGVLKEEINDLREGFGELKIRADAAELRIAENEDREIDAAQGLLEYGVNMESPAGEPDLESTLQASGWQTHRSRNRRTPGCELMSDLHICLMQSLSRCLAMSMAGCCWLGTGCCQAEETHQSNGEKPQQHPLFSGAGDP
ncbi:hypothetical protein JOQ06_001841, partial [Pogonophryne albipinna]